jgi:hypothetical protein
VVAARRPRESSDSSCPHTAGIPCIRAWLGVLWRRAPGARTFSRQLTENSRHRRDENW